MELATKNYIFTPFGCFFWAMYNINHGPFKFQIKLKEKKATNIKSIKYTGIYLFTKVQKISSSPTITLISPTTPPIYLYEKEPQQTK